MFETRRAPDEAEWKLAPNRRDQRRHRARNRGDRWGPPRPRRQRAYRMWPCDEHGRAV